MDEIKCLGCGGVLSIPEYVDKTRYDGQIVCEQCECLLDIKLNKEKVQKYRKVAEKARRVVYDTETIRMPDGRTETRKVAE